MHAPVSELTIRPADDRDSANLIALIDRVFGEYSNCFLDVDNEMPELNAPATAATNEEGRWWVVEDNGIVVGSCAVMPDGDGIMELKRLYIAKCARRRGLAASFRTPPRRLVRVRASP